MKKILALMLATLMVAGLFAGCNNTSDAPTLPTNAQGEIVAPYEVDENGNFIYGDIFKGTTIDWWIASDTDLNDSWFFKKLEEKFGFDLNLTCYDSATYSVKINTAVQTNQMPDIANMAVDYSVFNLYGDQGAFVNLIAPENLVKMPNLKKILEKDDAKDMVQYYVSGNGALYSLPMYHTNREVNFGWMYREDIFEKHGIEMWTDNESFLNVLRQLKQLYPNSYPLTGATMGTVFSRVMNSHGANSLLRAYDWDSDKWYLGAATEGYYEMMKVFQTAWNENLMDPDIFSNSTNDIHEAILNDQSFVYNSWIGYISTQNINGKAKDPNFQVSYAPHIGNGKGETLSQFSVSGTVINAQSINVDACIAIFDYLYSDEGRDLITLGEEGVTYKMEDGKRVYLNKDGSVMENPAIETLQTEFGMFVASVYHVMNPECVYFNYTPEEQEAQEIGQAGGLHEIAPAPVVPGDYADEYNDLITLMDKDITEYCQKFIRDNHSKEDWQAKCAEWEKKYGRVFEILNSI